jgi:hypothetical protein
MAHIQCFRRKHSVVVISKRRLHGLFVYTLIRAPFAAKRSLYQTKSMLAKMDSVAEPRWFYHGCVDPSTVIPRKITYIFCVRCTGPVAEPPGSKPMGPRRCFYAQEAVNFCEYFLKIINEMQESKIGGLVHLTTY